MRDIALLVLLFLGIFINTAFALESSTATTVFVSNDSGLDQLLAKMRSDIKNNDMAYIRDFIYKKVIPVDTTGNDMKWFLMTYMQLACRESANLELIQGIMTLCIENHIDPRQWRAPAILCEAIRINPAISVPQFLIRQGFNVNLRDRKSNFTPLHSLS